MLFAIALVHLCFGGDGGDEVFFFFFFLGGGGTTALYVQNKVLIIFGATTALSSNMIQLNLTKMRKDISLIYLKIYGFEDLLPLIF